MTEKATLQNEYGNFEVLVEQTDIPNNLVEVTLLENSPFAPKGSTSWVELENVTVRRE